MHVARQASARIAESLRKASVSRVATLALSGGNTPRETYHLLAHEPAIDWTKICIYWVDERAVAPTDDRSNYRWAKATLLDVARVPVELVHRMPADRPEREGAARDYEALLREKVPAGRDGTPTLDVVVLGVGDDGHTASLFPAEATVDIRDRWVVAVPGAAQREPRLTLTAPILQAAEKVFVLAVGSNKRVALDRVFREEGDLHATPARLLRSARGKTTWLVDEAAAGR